MQYIDLSVADKTGCVASMVAVRSKVNAGAAAGLAESARDARAIRLSGAVLPLHQQ